ncbi:TPA: hypothetical protein JG819_004693 [Vibrio parahaemolyticus]|nr:hypothetical protein [Vibrio parahaemolyticus]HAV1545593.1 hypothetical protein [Vibrio parahaemolyticus]
MATYRGWEQSELAAIHFLKHIDAYYYSLLEISEMLPKKSPLRKLLKKADSELWVESWAKKSFQDKNDTILNVVKDYDKILASGAFAGHPDFKNFVSKKKFNPSDAFVDHNIHNEINSLSTFECREDAEMTVASLFNYNFAIVRYQSQTMVVQKVFDEDRNINYTFSQIKDIRAYYSNAKVFFNVATESTVKCKSESAFELWLKSRYRRSFKGVVFNPRDGVSEDFLNMWDGLATQPIEPSREFATPAHAAMCEEELEKDKSISIILNHIFRIVCKERVKEYKYFLALLAQMVQETNVKNGVSIILKSEGRGTGKSTVGQLLHRIFGHHWFQVQSVEQLVGKFNSAIANKVVIIAEEAFWGGSQKDAGKLRTIITDPMISVEGKFRDVLNIKSFHRFIFFTNNDWVVPASYDERRFFVLDVNEEKKGDKEYFDKLYASIDDDRIIAEFLGYLMSYDYSDINVREALRTEEFYDQVEMSLPEEAKWWLDVLYEGHIVDPAGFNNTYRLQEGVRVPMSVCYASYCDHAKGAPNYAKLTKKRFGSFFREMINMLSGYKKMPTESEEEETPGYSGARAYEMKSLEELKLIFTHKYGIKIE